MGRAVWVCMVLAGALAVVVVGAAAQEIPPDTVSTVFLSDTIPGYGAVGGVVADGLGFVYVADFRNAVWRISPEGKVHKFADGLYGASGNAIGPRGYLDQSSFNGNYVARISRTGEVETYADEGLSGPVGIAANGDGDIFVVNCTNGTVSKIDRSRRVTEFARSELFACPNGITFDDRGDLYVVNFGNTLVVRITPDGEATEFANIPGTGGNGHITFARGTFFVTKFRGHQVFRLERDGSSTVLAGTGQPGEDDGPALEATFTRPNGIGVSTGGRELWVNDVTEQPAAGRGASVVTMRRIRLVTLTDVLGQIDLSEGVDRVRQVYEAYHEARGSEDTSAEAVALGYQWFQTPYVAEGVALFELSSDRFPESAFAQFQRGEAYRYTGQPEKAAVYYRRALDLQPDHPQAAARLVQVTGG